MLSRLYLPYQFGDSHYRYTLSGLQQYNSTLILSNICLLLDISLFLYSTAITSGRIQVNGANLHYQRTGCGDHAVLLLPGALGVNFTLTMKEMIVWGPVYQVNGFILYLVHCWLTVPW